MKLPFVAAVYFAAWSVYEPKHFVLDLPAENLTHVFYAFMKINDSGEVLLPDPWGDTEMPMPDGSHGLLAALAKLKTRNPALKTLMSIGGWGTHLQFAAVMLDPAKTSVFVSTAVALMHEHGFDGLDIDWEYPENDTQGQQLVGLLRMLRDELGAANSDSLLTVAAPASPYNVQNYRVSEMDAYLSFWNIMCYDFVGPEWSARAGYHSNLRGDNGNDNLCADSAIRQYLSLGVDLRKLVLGMPLYGKCFYKPETRQPGSRFSNNSPYPPVLDYHAIDRSKECYDAQRVACYIYDDQKQLLVSYDSPQCAIEKAKYIKQRNLRGGFWWDSKGDPQASLLFAFLQEMNE